MSGGSLDYIYSKVNDAINHIRANARTPLHRAFADHLEKVSKALHDLEWEWSCDYGKGDSDAAIREVVSESMELEAAISAGRKTLGELADALAKAESKLAEKGKQQHE